MTCKECRYLDILTEELVLAEGCTEPIAIAYAGALATHHLGATPIKMEIELSANMIKNVDGVVVPNSGNRVGVQTAVVLGAFYGDHEADLLVISKVTKEESELIEAKLKECPVKVKLAESPAKLYIKLTAKSENDEVVIEIKHTHTNITLIEKNGELIMNFPCSDLDFNSSLTDRSTLTIEGIVNFAKTVELDESLVTLLENMIKHNKAIAKEGLEGKYGLNVGAAIKRQMDKGNYSKCVRTYPAAVAASGSDARMSGSSKPVMSLVGSGNLGLTVSMGINEVAQMQEVNHETLLRALILGILVTIHVKTQVGRLSAFCGVTCGASGVAAATTFMLKGTQEQIDNSIITTLADISGLLCDGAKNTCALKIASGITSAVDAAYISLEDASIKDVGFIADCVEETIKNIGIIANEALSNADQTILKIMTNRR